MPEILLCDIDPGLLPAFSPYLLPRAAQALREGWPGGAAVGAIMGGRTCGAAVGLAEDGALEVASLYVDPRVRRQGVAGRLMDALEARSGTPGRVWAEWILPTEDFRGVSAFLTRRGFRCGAPCEPVYRLDTALLGEVPVLRRACSPAFRPDPNILPLAQWPAELRAEAAGDGSIDFRLRLGAFGDGLWPELSLGYRYGGRISAYLLFKRTGEREVALAAALSRPGAHPAAFLQLAAAALHRGRMLMGGDFICWVETINDTSEALLHRLAGQAPERWWTGSGACEKGARAYGKA